MTTLFSELPVLSVVLKSTALLIFAIAVVSIVMRKSSAGARHLAWILAIAGVLVLPLLIPFLPEWRILPSWENEPVSEATTISTLNFTPNPHENFTIGIQQPEAEIISMGVEPNSSGSAQSIFVGIWLSGAALLILRLVTSRLFLFKIGRNSQPLPGGNVLDEIETIRRNNFIHRKIRVLIAGGTEQKIMPMTWGIFRPTLLLPSEVENWQPSLRRAVLLHEVAHIRRWDAATNLLVQFVCALYWFNPLAWLAAWRIHIEREQACDDFVLRDGRIKASDYAAYLLQILAGFRSPHVSSVCAIAMAAPRRSQLEIRLKTITAHAIDRRPVSIWKFVTVSLAAAMLVLPIAMIQADDKSKDEAENQKTEEKVPVDVPDIAIKKKTNKNDDILESDHEKPVKKRLIGVTTMVDEAQGTVYVIDDTEPREENSNLTSPKSGELRGYRFLDPKEQKQNSIYTDIAGNPTAISNNKDKRYLLLNPKDGAVVTDFDNDGKADFLVVSPGDSVKKGQYLYRIRSQKPSAVVGVGLQLNDTGKEGFSVMGIIENSPAGKSGKFRIGDLITGVAQNENGKMVDVRELDLLSLVKLTRGDTGSSVTLRISPVGGGSERKITLKRSPLALQSSQNPTRIRKTESIMTDPYNPANSDSNSGFEYRVVPVEKTPPKSIFNRLQKTDTGAAKENLEPEKANRKYTQEYPITELRSSPLLFYSGKAPSIEKLKSIEAKAQAATQKLEASKKDLSEKNLQIEKLLNELKALKEGKAEASSKEEASKASQN